MDWGELLPQVAATIPAIVDWVAIAVFMVGFAKATLAWVSCELRRGVGPRERQRHIQSIRLSLGGYILLGLEIMIISDVVHSCVHPDLMSLAELGALVVVRTFIGFFLGKELEQLHPEEPT